MGKAEGRGENWHGHVTAVTVRARPTLMRQPHTLRPGAPFTLPSRWLPNTAAKAWRRS